MEAFDLIRLLRSNGVNLLLTERDTLRPVASTEAAAATWRAHRPAVVACKVELLALLRAEAANVDGAAWPPPLAALVDVHNRGVVLGLDTSGRMVLASAPLDVRAALGELLDVHAATVAAWLLDAEAEANDRGAPASWVAEAARWPAALREAWRCSRRDWRRSAEVPVWAEVTTTTDAASGLPVLDVAAGPWWLAVRWWALAWGYLPTWLGAPVRPLDVAAGAIVAAVLDAERAAEAATAAVRPGREPGDDDG